MARNPQFPEDSDRFAKAMTERRKQFEVERLVELVGAERRDREARVERNREAIRRAKDALARTRPIADAHRRRVMAKARAILAPRDDE